MAKLEQIKGGDGQDVGIGVSLEGDTLTITCKLVEGRVSSGGTSHLFASTQGNRRIMDGMMLGVNLYRPIPNEELSEEAKAKVLEKALARRGR